MSEEEIFGQFMRTMRSMGKVGDDLFSDRLTNNEFVALCILSDVQKKQQKEQTEPGIYVSVLAATMHSSMPAVSRLLRAMEEKGWIERSVDRKDRRNTFVRITEEGRQMQQEQIAWMGGIFMDTIRKIGTEKMGAMLSLLENFALEMEEKIKEMKQHV